MKFVAWVKDQIEWVKSFFSEPDGKGSNKRLLGSAVITAFLIPYIKTSIALQKLEDIPTMWVIMIGSILGLNVIDWAVKGYINKSITTTTGNNSNTDATTTN